MQRTVFLFQNIASDSSCRALLFVYLKESCGLGLLRGFWFLWQVPQCFQPCLLLRRVPFCAMSLEARRSIYVLDRLWQYWSPRRNVILLPSCCQPAECCHSVVKRETSALLVFCIDAVLPELGSVGFFPACEMGFTRPLTRVKFTE